MHSITVRRWCEIARDAACPGHRGEDPLAADDPVEQRVRLGQR
ncbi:hypothetical protein STVIR_1763 [Streptomyces viridochromogenes Tue57]|uniref:Uncharacterized protein n=1 Tax=Streptomyces viridochromogenes Tue57 TaxID=1160705 RepID=L8PPI3_STRVR|nr:hypothetical protein STVIR_1763 [Streptomyces viridochromogenes Tue57]